MEAPSGSTKPHDQRLTTIGSHVTATNHAFDDGAVLQDAQVAPVHVGAFAEDDGGAAALRDLVTVSRVREGRPCDVKGEPLVRLPALDRQRPLRIAAIAQENQVTIQSGSVASIPNPRNAVPPILSASPICRFRW